MSTSEVITIVLLFHLSGFRTFKHFYIFYVQKHMKSEFPHTVSYNRFVELQQSCIPKHFFLSLNEHSQQNFYRKILFRNRFVITS